MERPLLADLSAKDVRRMPSIAPRRTSSRHEVVFHRDDLSGSKHLIARGRFAPRTESLRVR